MDFRRGRRGGMHTQTRTHQYIGKRSWRYSGKRKSEDEGISVYLHASWYTRELMPLTHRCHLRGLSYGDIFDRAIIPNTIYTARARRDAHIIR